MNDNTLTRDAFTRRGMFLGLAGIFAAKAAAKFDPAGEPAGPGAALIEINAPGTTLSNLNVSGDMSRRSAAIAVRESTKWSGTTRIHDGEIVTGRPE